LIWDDEVKTIKNAGKIPALNNIISCGPVSGHL